MKALLILFGSLMCLAFSGQQCQRSTHGNSEIPPALFQRWFHSFEEDHDTLQVYRPESFDFPLARGRTGFGFSPDGKFEQYDIAPADGLEKTQGTWQLEPGNVVLVQLSNARHGRPVTYRIRIVSLEKGQLIVRLL
jgi:hypothetical protein